MTSSDLVKILAGVLYRAGEDLAEKLRTLPQESGASSTGTSSPASPAAEKPLTPLAAAKAASAPKPKAKAAEKTDSATAATSTETQTQTQAQAPAKIAAHVCGPHAMHLDPAKYKPMIVAPADCYYCKEAAKAAVPATEGVVTLNLKTVTAKAKELVEKCGKPKLAEVLKAFGVASVTPGPGKQSLPEAEYSNFFEMCDELIEAKETPPAVEEEEPL